ncbi:streptomycin biosynthesis enzyme StrG [Pseudomonas sp. SDI]|uniref:streptomycin biosynthesis enzyme StrG n=1 Tax=Pseudomonas sp. SDI TaxID=2170734 RepID=UPI001058316B|nr:streptomycin biosynthesis enzyme StrG [Pseudomonas sp. SDI]
MELFRHQRAGGPCGVWMAKVEYDTAAFPFQQIVARDVYGVSELAQLHLAQAERDRWRSDERAGYQANLRLRERMKGLADDCPLYQAYHAFARNVIAAAFGGKIAYANQPKWRVHLAQTCSVSAWHCDAQVTRRSDQLTVWVPFVDVHEGSAMHVETGYGRADFSPIALRYGQALVFDGGYLAHGTLYNHTDISRVSMDLRFACHRGTTASFERLREARPSPLPTWP